MKTRYLLILLAMSLLSPAPRVEATVIYGVTSTSMEEGNARIVSFDTDDLSSDSDAPTTLTELATIERANDFMGGCSMGDLYYGYYNITDMETQTVVQYFCTIDFATGEADILHKIDPTMSPDGIYLIDMTYEPKTGMIVALENQYDPNSQSFLSSIQAVHPLGGKLSLLYDLDAKYSAICADGEGGYYLAEIQRLGDGEGTPVFHKADNRFNITRLMPPKPGLKAESSMAHSMLLLDGKLYLVTGRTVTIVNLSTKSTTTCYLDRDVYGITTVAGTAGIPAVAADSAQGVRLDGKRVILPSPGSVELFTPQGCKAAALPRCSEADFSALPSGLYILRATFGSSTVSMKIRL